MRVTHCMNETPWVQCDIKPPSRLLTRFRHGYHLEQQYRKCHCRSIQLPWIPGKKDLAGNTTLAAFSWMTRQRLVRDQSQLFTVTKILFIFPFQQLFVNKTKGSDWVGVSFYSAMNSACGALVKYWQTWVQQARTLMKPRGFRLRLGRQILEKRPRFMKLSHCITDHGYTATVNLATGHIKSCTILICAGLVRLFSKNVKEFNIHPSLSWVPT